MLCRFLGPDLTKLAASIYFMSLGTFSLGTLILLVRSLTYTEAATLWERTSHHIERLEVGKTLEGETERNVWPAPQLRNRSQITITSQPLCALSEFLPHRLVSLTSYYFKPLGFGVVFVKQLETEIATYKSPPSFNNSDCDLCASLSSATSYPISLKRLDPEVRRFGCMLVLHLHCLSLQHPPSP